MRSVPPRFSHPWRRALVRAAGAYALVVLAAIGSTVWSACRRAAEPPVRLVSAAPEQTSVSCRACHADAHAAWHGTDHARANRPVSAEEDRAAFSVDRDAVPARAGLSLEWTGEGPVMTFAGPAGTTRHTPRYVLGNAPLRQYLVPEAGGRWQPVEWAFDPVRGDWFSVFGDEQREPGEWGHWLGRGMNWNSMCAHCHMTGFRKGYDPAPDAYRSTWVEHGVGCIQCHGPMPAGHGTSDERAAIAAGATDPEWVNDPHRAMQTCAYCHARNEPLTAEFVPGEPYHDHFRITLPVEPGVFYPDGQQWSEDFNWTSMLLSRMHHAGVTCMDCHEPHSTATRLPAENNQLCQQCHAAPGRVMPTTGVRAPVIDPTAHSHHAEGSTGNQCVSCHMPTTTYMARAPRHDHAWLKPDPLLTQELGIPNACSRCHEDQPVEWAITHATAWYGDRLQSRQRVRARAVAAAQRREAGAGDALLRLLVDEDIPAWRATYLLLLANPAPDPQVQAAAERGLADPSPLVRSAATQVLAARPSARSKLRPLLNDPVRLVRLDAAWALADELAPGSPAARELQDYLHLSADQPTGQLRVGQYLANVGRLAEAERAMGRAAEWDPRSAGIHEMHAQVLHALGRPTEAAAALMRAGRWSPGEGDPFFRAALLFAEAGQADNTREALRQALAREPGLHRAWYNLGLLEAQENRLDESVAALQRAEELAPSEADYPYALATVLHRQGDVAGARAAVARALAADPAHPSAQALARRLDR